MSHSLKLTLIASIVTVMIAPTAWAQQRSPFKKAELEEQTKGKIRQLGEIELANTSAQQLVQSPVPTNPANPPDPALQRQGNIIPITGVKANPTSIGVEVILETPVGTQLQVTNRSAGSNFIVDVSGGQLRLLSGEAFTFRSDKPVEGITQITAINLDANTVRVTVVGEKALPNVELYDDNLGLVFAVATKATATSPQQPTQTPQTQQPGNQTPQESPSAQGDEPIELVVTGEQDGYSIPDASTATRTDTPIRDIPASIQVIPQEIIRDQGATSSREALRNVSGVTFSTGGGNRAENFIVRGFGITGTQFQNGIRDDFYTTRTQIDLANIDRIEVLKGPASVLFGRAEPAGIINYVTKQPLLNPYYNVSFTVGNYSFYRPAIDFSGSLTADKKLAYRLNVAYENAGSFRDFVDTERFIVAPTLAWQISPDTKLSAEVSYLHDARPIDRGLIVLSNNQVANIPISRLLGAAGDGDFDETRATFFLDHRFNPNLSLRSAFRYTDSSEVQQDGYVASFSGPLRNNRFLSIDDNQGTQKFETYKSQNDLIAKFNTGSIQHTVLFGLEFARQFRSSFSRSRSAGEIDIFNPNYNFTFGIFRSPNQQREQLTSFGVYLQDQITLLENLKLVLGGRFDTYNSDSVANGRRTETDAEAFSPRAGIVYQPIPEISLYANYTRSFTPVSGASFNGTSFDPQRGTGYEVGVKTELANGRLSSTLAFYDITLSNILTPDLVNRNFSIQVGEQRSRGIELDIAGEILTGWKVIASYAYTDAEITKDNVFAVGNRLNNVARNTASLWTTYTIPDGYLKGFGIGGGVFFVDARAGDLANTFEVPSYARFDAALYYNTDRFRAAINFKNLFDTTYYEGVQNRFQVYPGAPFTVQGTISWEF